MNASNYLHVDDATVDKAVSLWRAGELVAIPTETVYGLAADATNAMAVAKIYAVKSRPQFNPLIVHMADREMVERYAGHWPDQAAGVLAQQFWPGPLTLVIKRPANCPLSDLVTAGGDTVAIRVPSHPIARQLLKAFGGPLAAPSANRSGRVSPTTVDHVKSELEGAIALIIDGGPCTVGLESTVIDTTVNPPRILRPGAVTRQDVVQAFTRSAPPGGLKLAEETGSNEIKSPGQLESHYAPSLPVRLNATQARPGEALLAFGPEIHVPLNADGVLNLSTGGDLIEAAANLFSYLRALDQPRFQAIAVMPIPDCGVGEAINDRLRRAAAAR